MKPKKVSWDLLLVSEVLVKLKEVGLHISEARKLRNMSVMDLASRMGVDRRTVSQLELGSPKVSLGIFFQALNALNLLQGIEELVRPENDVEALQSTLKRIRRHQPLAKKINDEKVNF